MYELTKAGLSDNVNTIEAVDRLYELYTKQGHILANEGIGAAFSTDIIEEINELEKEVLMILRITVGR